MKRFSVRELVFLCLPVALIAGVGWMLSRQKSAETRAPASALGLAFHLEKPTMLEAFKGADVALVAELTGQGPFLLYSGQSDASLEVHAAQGVLKSRCNRPSGLWEEVWKGQTNTNGNTFRWLINEKAIPSGPLFLNVNSLLLATHKVPLRRTGRWKVDRTKIVPFSVAQLPPHPLVTIKSISIIQNSGGRVKAEIVFRLEGAGTNAKTSLECEMQGRSSGRPDNLGVLYGLGSDSDSLTKETVLTRVRQWSLEVSPREKRQIEFSGRVSANQRWPLGFVIQPFDLSKVKVGQKLPFKSFPLPLPPRSQ